MRPVRFARVLGAVVAAGLATAAFFTRTTWLPWFQAARPAARPAEAATPAAKIIVSDRAQQNLGLTARQLKAETVWKTIAVPGMVVDRPVLSDRAVVSPVTGVVSGVHHVPGDAVRPGEVLFTLKLLSESLHLTQTDLFKVSQDAKLARAQLKRLAIVRGAVSEERLIEVQNTITRLEVAARAYRQELLNRGLSPRTIDAVADGQFASAITVAVPQRPSGQKPLPVALVAQAEPATAAAPAFEVQELKVELGQQVQAGQTLCLLANHQALAIEGRAFRDETTLVERSVKEGWPVEVDFHERAAGWPVLKQSFRIRYIANTIDPVSRTFAFLLPLDNQARAIERDGKTQLLWRFRPGQKVWLRLRVEEVKNVFVVPPEAVTRDGAEAFVFTQNVNTFERQGVRVLFQERDRAVLANDGALPTFVKDKEVWTIPAVARTAAAQLNRMAKAGSSGVPRGYHVHADGSLHKNEDEAK